MGSAVLGTGSGRVRCLTFGTDMFEPACFGDTFAPSLVHPAVAGRKGLRATGWVAGDSRWSTTGSPLDLLCIHALEKQVPPGLIPGETWWVGMPESSEVFQTPRRQMSTAQ